MRLMRNTTYDVKGWRWILTAGADARYDLFYSLSARQTGGKLSVIQRQYVIFANRFLSCLAR